MATKGGINMVKYFFYKGSTIRPERGPGLVALGYAAAREREVAPWAVFDQVRLRLST